MDKIDIKKVYLYNKDLHNQTEKKEKTERIIWTIASLLITLIFTFGIVYIIRNDIWTNYIVGLYIALFIFAIIFFFCFMYNLLLLACFLSQKIMFSDRAYAVTNNDDIITFKFERNSPYFRYDLLKGNLLDEIVKILALQISVNKENKKMTKKVKEQNIALNDLYECLNIVNVYDIKEKEDYIEILCDYIDLIKNTSRKKQSLIIYKYYENWNELLKILNIKKDRIKEEITQKDGEYNGFVDFVLGSCLRKSNAIFFHTFFVIVLISSINSELKVEFALWLEIYIAILISILYCQKKALKHLYKNVANKEIFLLKKIKNNKIYLIIYSILLFIYSAMNIKELHTILIIAICIYIFLFIIKKRLEK